MEIEFFIPPDFFESANTRNNPESVSEKVARAVLETILRCPNVRKGNPNQGEPDYISGDKGYEVTLAIPPSVVRQIKGKSSSNEHCVTDSMEEEMINDIKDAAKRKAGKAYDRQVALFILAINPTMHWYYKPQLPLFPKHIDWENCGKKRNETFIFLYKQYIDTSEHDSPFENIYILQPTLRQTFVLYDINDFIRGKDFIKEIGINPGREMAFPTFKYIPPTNEDPSFFLPMYKIKPIRYVKENRQE